MPRPISIQSLDTPPLDILQVDTGTLTIGREPENHVVVDSDTVSRQHGSLIEAEGHWVFRDFESTNGTWINGVRLAPGQMRLLRHGDIIQLADFPMRISETHHDQNEPRPPSLLIFFNEQFEAEFPLQPSRSTFVIGGPEGDFYLQGVSNEVPQLEISYEGTRLELSVGVSPMPIIVNGMAVGGVALLSDRDEIVIGQYRILVNDIHSAIESEIGSGKYRSKDRPQAVSSINAPSNSAFQLDEETAWESEASRRKAMSGKRFVFGSDPTAGSDETTSTIGGFEDYRSPGGFEMSASHRFSRAAMEAEGGAKGKGSDSLMVFFGIFVFCVLIGLGAYFFLSLS